MAFSKFTKLFLNILSTSTPESLLQTFNELQNNIDITFSSLNKIQNDSTILTNISLTANQTTQVNHKLGRKLMGWKIIRKRGQANIYDTQDDNPSPTLTLWLYSDTDVTVDIEVC